MMMVMETVKNTGMSDDSGQHNRMIPKVMADERRRASL